MISFIICSTKSELNPVLVENISATVKIPFELIVLDNSHGRYSIFTAYQEGVERAIYPFLCFIHEDILFRSDNVGECIVNSFEENPELGLLGVVGNKLLPKYPFGWWTSGYKYYAGGIIKNNKKGKYIHHYKEKSPIHTKLEEVVVCDGLFLCIRKELFSKIRWDSDTYNGFHCYDMDICMQVIGAGYKVMIAKDIVIEHFSTGSPTESFAQGCTLFAKKWKDILPVFTTSISMEEVLHVQEQSLTEYIIAYPLAVRYRHLEQNKIGKVLISLLKKIKK